MIIYGYTFRKIKLYIIFVWQEYLHYLRRILQPYIVMCVVIYLYHTLSYNNIVIHRRDPTQKNIWININIILYYIPTRVSFRGEVDGISTDNKTDYNIIISYMYKDDQEFTMITTSHYSTIFAQHIIFWSSCILYIMITTRAIDSSTFFVFPFCGWVRFYFHVPMTYGFISCPSDFNLI